jgi:hypothetical protein
LFRSPGQPLYVLLALAVLAPHAEAGGVGVSVQAHPPADSATITEQDTTQTFHLYVVPAFWSRKANRDLELLWSGTYSQVGKPLDPGTGQQNDLDRFGIALCNATNNPFGHEAPDVQLVYDYFNFANRTYNASEDSLIGFQRRGGHADRARGPLPVFAGLVTSRRSDRVRTSNALAFDAEHLRPPGWNADSGGRDKSLRQRAIPSFLAQRAANRVHPLWPGRGNRAVEPPASQCGRIE